MTGPELTEKIIEMVGPVIDGLPMALAIEGLAAAFMGALTANCTRAEAKLVLVRYVTELQHYDL